MNGQEDGAENATRRSSSGRYGSPELGGCALAPCGRRTGPREGGAEPARTPRLSSALSTRETSAVHPPAYARPLSKTSGGSPERNPGANFSGERRAPAAGDEYGEVCGEHERDGPVPANAGTRSKVRGRRPRMEALGHDSRAYIGNRFASAGSAWGADAESGSGAISSRRAERYRLTGIWVNGSIPLVLTSGRLALALESAKLQTHRFCFGNHMNLRWRQPWI